MPDFINFRNGDKYLQLEEQRSVYKLPEKCLQYIEIISSGLDATEGTLYRYERDEASVFTLWKPVGEKIPVTLGRNGCAWSRATVENSNLPKNSLLKKEGDGKAPAGIFTLGDAYGYAEKPPSGCKLSYRQATTDDYFVDDPDSPHYNTWVRTTAPDKPWKSAETMRRADDLYEFGIIVNHNMNPIIPGDGSAIFIHPWREPGAPTAGCTAMSREHILELLSWLDKDAKPALVIDPGGELRDSAHIEWDP